MSIELPDFSQARVLVVGDVMLDRYWHGDTGRISPEAPVPVVRIQDEEQRPGGAGNVALNIAALGGRPLLLGQVGEDEAGRALAQRLAAAGVDCRLQPSPGSPTITKLRVISRHQQLIRLDFEQSADTSAREAPLAGPFQRLLGETDVVLLSDYGKGALHRVDQLIREALAAGKTVLVDPKQRDFSCYRGASLLTPNLSEFEAVVGTCSDEAELVQRGLRLAEELQLGALLITRGEQGMSLLQPGQPPRHLPTHAREVYDVTGAGDTVIGVLAAGLAAGVPLESATRLANLAAGVVVAKLGTASVSVGELQQALQEHQVARRGIVGEDELVAILAAARAQGERIVFTNGCFDILHPGHVTYLEQASRLGDRLVVAVNTDASVRKLKGPDRPVNGLEGRMTVLAALSCVDWVLPFGEDTPERLICRLLPDYLVKGGDNEPSRIPGGDCVRRAGGQVLVMEYVDGCSTTNLIRAIRGPGGAGDQA
jgi:D-beta-D-heptose 7-phosphate kinase/D-beta-D-heptose 1-phosphate adenosyltransferase